MDVSPLVEKGSDQGCRNIGKPAGFGRKIIGHVSHVVGQIGNFRGDDEYTGVCL